MGVVFQRPVDLVLASALLVLGAIAFLVIAVLVKTTSPGPVFFRQVRVGKDGRPFRIWKFRTMVQDAELILQTNKELGEDHRRNWKLHRDPRTTRVGRVLRKTSIDELPQLLNVVAGDMSLIGPRPVQPTELDSCYGALAPAILSVKPGMTGLWQVSGRSLLSYEQRIALDLRYVHEVSMKTDLEIALKTIPCICRGKGAI